jgi:tRNA threonylcarbamoyladenosine biosynthesis protein TsaE
MEYLSTSTEETKQLAIEVAKNVIPGATVLLYGDLGSGKTTFTRFLVEALGFTDRVQSPTFVLSRIYKAGHNQAGINKIFHLDLYRITTPEEMVNLDLADYLQDKSALTIVEWPELVQNLLPKDAVRVVKISFAYLDETRRKINVQNNN